MVNQFDVAQQLYTDAIRAVRNDDDVSQLVGASRRAFGGVSFGGGIVTAQAFVRYNNATVRTLLHEGKVLNVQQMKRAATAVRNLTDPELARLAEIARNAQPLLPLAEAIGTVLGSRKSIVPIDADLLLRVKVFLLLVNLRFSDGLTLDGIATLGL